jgi:hypothetical protein
MAAIFLAVGLLLPATSQASLLFGNLNFSGSNNVLISQGMINFGPTMGAIGITTSTGDYGFLGGTSGTVKNIDNPPYVVDTPVATPSFVTLVGAPNITFTLQVLMSGVFSPAGCAITTPVPGQVCTPNVPELSPFNLSNSAGGTSSASFIVMGIEADSLTGTTTPFTGIFTAQFTVPYQSLLATIASNGTISTSYSATFATSGSINPTIPTPEPGSMLTAAAGALFLGISLFLRQRFERKPGLRLE